MKIFQIITGKEEKTKKNRLDGWLPFLEAIGLPTSYDALGDETLTPKQNSMPLVEFRRLYKKQGKMPGYWEHDYNVCLAGSSILTWVNGGESTDHDYFPVDLQQTEYFTNYLISKGYQITGFQGNKNWITENWGQDWKPMLPLAGWYCDLLHLGDGKALPVGTNVIPGTEEIVRAINFFKDGNPIKKQIILVVRGEPVEVINTFDFSISQWAIDSENIYWGNYTVQDTLRHRVRIHRIHHPLSSVRRMIKYSNRGYFFCNGTLIALANALTDYTRERERLGLDPLEDQVISLD
jgi:hypothetical protein